MGILGILVAVVLPSDPLNWSVTGWAKSGKEQPSHMLDAASKRPERWRVTLLIGVIVVFVSGGAAGVVFALSPGVDPADRVGLGVPAGVSLIIGVIFCVGAWVNKKSLFASFRNRAD